MSVPEQSHQVVSGDRSAASPFESIRAGHNAAGLADNSILVLCKKNCAKIRVGVASQGVLSMPNGTNHRLKTRGVGEGLGRPNAGGVVAGGDASVNADGDRLLYSASDGVERADGLAIVPVRPIGRACDER